MGVVVSHIIGGLGNQMFQYAAGRALALRRGVPLLLDLSDFAGYRCHQGFELERVFSCHVAVATPEEIREVLGWQSSQKIRRITSLPSLRFLRTPCFIVEPHFNYWPGLNAIPQQCYLRGYWQTERYFAEEFETIRADFTFRQPLAGRNIELAEEIGASNAVSLHLRRGDYVSNLKAQATHGVCSLDYYQAAIKYIADCVEAPHYFVFSDDMDWVKKNLKIAQPCRYVDHNRGQESYNDMRLMSFCKHNIIANSSFSWWGAWLNPSSDKIVIAPRRWFNVSHFDTRDLHCPGWIVL